MMRRRRDFVLSLVLFRHQLPMELRFLICDTYFPFLPNERDCLRADTLISMLSNSLQYGYNNMSNTIYCGEFCFVLEICYNSNDQSFDSKAYLCQTRNIKRIYIIFRLKLHFFKGDNIYNIHKAILRRYRYLVLDNIDRLPQRVKCAVI